MGLHSCAFSLACAWCDVRTRKSAAASPEIGSNGGIDNAHYVHIYYRGEHGAARRFAQEMLASGTAAAVLFAPSHVLLSYQNAK